MMPETPPLFLTADDLPEIRRNTDWPRLLEALALILDTRRCKIGDWWAHSPFAEDRQASFHITEKGWYCFSTGQGGGALELVQQLRGLSCYAAARWLIDNGISHCGAAGGVLPLPAAAPGETPAGSEPAADSPADERLPNPPIRQNLLPRLQPHPELERRGISPATAAYLGCGYLPEGGKSPLAGRIVFQVRGIRRRPDGEAAPVILTHLGRALDDRAGSQRRQMALLPGLQQDPRTLQYRPACPGSRGSGAGAGHRSHPHRRRLL